jgi:transcription elongation factor Elf1
MNCPSCGGPTAVEQVRKDNGRRRRKCRRCGLVFHTQEMRVDAFDHGGDRHSGRFRAEQREAGTA